MPIRDAVRDVLRAQASGRPWAQAQIKLRTAYSSFIRYYGPINHTVVTTLTDAETGEEREVHRRPNLAHFADDPDCWLVASIEDYDLETGIARKGPIFDQRVVSPPATPLITSAADALAVTLNEVGHVDPDRLAELLECEPDEALKQLGTAVFRNPMTEAWETADAYLSGPVRTKLAAAEAAAALDPQFDRNVEALREAPAEGHPALRNHRPPRRTLDTDRRYRGLHPRRDGRRRPGSSTRRSSRPGRSMAAASSAPPPAPPNGAHRGAMPARCCTTR